MVGVFLGRVRRLAPIQLLALVFLLAAFVDVVRNRLVAADRFFDPWQTGDWLINYQGGFVRRGLVGEVLHRLAGDGDALVDAVTAVQIVLLLVSFVAVGWLVVITAIDWTWTMLLFSPSWLLFGVIVPEAGLRKELLGLAVVAVLAVAVRSDAIVVTAAVLVPVFAIAALSHEAVVVMLPAILALLWHGRPVSRRDRYRFVISIAYTFVAGVALIVAVRYPGTSQVTGICESWRSRGLPCEGGALDAMTGSLRDSMSDVADRYPHAYRFLPVAVLAFLPIWLTGLPRYRPRVCLAVAGAALPLFIIAMDYGRWIHIIAAQLSLVALAVAPELQRRRQVVQIGPLWAVAYCTLWAMHHFDPNVAEPLAIRWLTFAHDLVL